MTDEEAQNYLLEFMAPGPASDVLEAVKQRKGMKLWIMFDFTQRNPQSAT